MLGNERKDQETGNPILYDAGPFWAHNECNFVSDILPACANWIQDLGKGACARYYIGPGYFDEYYKHTPKSAPEEDWEDRIILYTVWELAVATRGDFWHV